MNSPFSPLIITGMHRSGTSLVASWLARGGVHLGEQLFRADRHNPHGYFEDEAFLQFHRQLIARCVDPASSGWPDWGWTETERWHPERAFALQTRAQQLLQQGACQSTVWGWKDPRTTLFLNFWHTLAPQARYLLLYRFPWEVADSMQRLEADIFLRHPEYAYSIWTYYNRQVLAFYQCHAEQCLLLNVNRLVQEPEQLSHQLKEKLGIELAVSPARFAELFAPQQFTTSTTEKPLINLLELAHPAVINLLHKLDAVADLSGQGLWQKARALRFTQPPPPEPAVSIIIPCYNQGEFLLEAVASVEHYAPADCELLIINDGSQQPQTVTILHQLEMAGYPILTQPNSGLAAARNRAIAATRGRYLLPLDADNRLRHGYIEQATAILDHQPDVGVVYSDCLEFGLSTRRRWVPSFALQTQLQIASIDACAIFRRQTWLDCGGYDPALPAWEDWEFWIHTAKQGWHFYHIPEVLFEYRVRPDSMTQRMGPAEIQQIMRRIWQKHAALYQQYVPEIHSEQRLVAHQIQLWRWAHPPTPSLRGRVHRALSRVKHAVQARWLTQSRHVEKR